MSKLTIYTRTTCAQCKMVKRYLAIKDVVYETVNLDDNPEIAEELDKLGLRSVPITTNNSRYVTGYNPAELTKLISSFQA